MEVALLKGNEDTEALIPVPPFLRGVRGDQQVPKITANYFSNNYSTKYICKSETPASILLGFWGKGEREKGKKKP
ncbi:MAG: hypothetical protein RMY16_15350, partial [Nostoc sp. DedQUE12b]|uniref:hypothetical protein n=1 Tax=Nostoc sp. DedQUE12b TaxID=3075398 RepID=UPI002AD56619